MQSWLPRGQYVFGPDRVPRWVPEPVDPSRNALGSNLGMGSRTFLPGVPGVNPLIDKEKPKAGPNMGLLQLGLQMMMNSGRNGGGQAPLIEQMLGNPELLASIFKKKGGVQ